MSREEALPGRNISPPLDLPDHRAIAEIRLILALATLVAVSFMPPSNVLPIPLHYGAIATYIASALVLYWVALNKPTLVRQRLVYWLDAAWLLLIISLSVNSGGPLFLLLLFPVLVAAAQVGFVQGMGVSLVTTAAYVLTSGWLTDEPYLRPEHLLQAGTLLAMGFMVSRWAGAESQLKHELSALNSLGKSPGLRDDAEPFWMDTLKELTAYFGDHRRKSHRLRGETEGEGCGLGLSIAARVAALSHAELALGDGLPRANGGYGFAATLRFGQPTLNHTVRGTAVRPDGYRAARMAVTVRAPLMLSAWNFTVSPTLTAFRSSGSCTRNTMVIGGMSRLTMGPCLRVILPFAASILRTTPSLITPLWAAGGVAGWA